MTVIFLSPLTASQAEPGDVVEHATRLWRVTRLWGEAAEVEPLPRWSWRAAWRRAAAAIGLGGWR